VNSTYFKMHGATIKKKQNMFFFYFLYYKCLKRFAFREELSERCYHKYTQVFMQSLNAKQNNRDE